jgi:hypothetical protein
MVAVIGDAGISPYVATKHGTRTRFEIGTLLFSVWM